MEELLNCPFCGGKASISPYDGGETVICMDCLCRTPMYRGDDALEKSIAAWNRRAAPENKAHWIPVNEKLPEPEMRVLVCTETRCADGKTYKHITTGMYEDGSIWRENSDWCFNDFSNLGPYDEDQDDYKIPEGWWEYTIYNDDEGNYPIGDVVTHWMPLPEPPQDARKPEGSEP